jgi:hypothetical protein
MTAIAFDFALFARFAAYTQLLTFALRAALTSASVVAAFFLASAPNLVFIVGRRVVRQF